MATRGTLSRVRPHRVIVDAETRPYCGACQLPYRHPAHIRCAWCHRVMPGTCNRCPDAVPNPVPIMAADPLDPMLWDENDTP